MTVPVWCKVSNKGIFALYKYQRQVRMELLDDNNLLAKSRHSASLVSVISNITVDIPIYITKNVVKNYYLFF